MRKYRGERVFQVDAKDKTNQKKTGRITDALRLFHAPFGLLPLPNWCLHIGQTVV